MDLPLDSVFIPALILIVAFLYASVGHGGASGYLAIMSLFGYAPDVMASTALMLNVLVASLAFAMYARAGHFSWRHTWPFLLTSIPAAYIGGAIQVPMQTYGILLALALLWAALRMLGTFGKTATNEHDAETPLTLKVALPTGAAIGLVSGIVGVGGGIFLSPLMLLCGWADVKRTSAASALFIVVNAVAGLLGRFSRGGIVVEDVWPLLLAAGAGGALGAYLGAHQFSTPWLRRLLAIVLLIATFKLLRTYF